MKNKEKKPYSKKAPKPAVIKILVHDPPASFDGKGWKDYYIVPLDQYAKVLLVAWHGQDITFETGQSSVDEIQLGGDSSKQSPRPGD
jgi:hypothetical protein